MSGNLLKKIEELNQIGISLSAERDTEQLLEKILTSAKVLTKADGATLYLIKNEAQLSFDLIQNDSLNIYLVGFSTRKLPFDPLPLKLKNGKDNLSTIATYTVNKKETVNIKDIYNNKKFDFSGALAFDKKADYITKSMLTIPLLNVDNECLGVLQLINALDENNNITIFDKQSESLARSLASQATIALHNNNLLEEHKKLFESFSKLIADTIDKKSSYTGAHCQRVPILTMLIARKASQMEEGVFKDFKMNETELFELETAAWLHDCGKLTTPEHVMDKATKLHTIYDRIGLLNTRLGLKAYEDLIQKYNIPLAEIQATRNKYHTIYQRLEQINTGGEVLAKEDFDYLTLLKENIYTALDGSHRPMLNDEEFENLTIERGTLNESERLKIQEHAAVSIEMLSALPFPKELQKVCEYAGGHHERMDGKGYPNQLTREQLSIPARMMGVADIFEALSAGDRPYKKGKTLSESLKILGYLKLDNHIDSDTFNLFIKEKIYLDYANSHLKPEQIDDVIHANIPGYDGND